MKLIPVFFLSMFLFAYGCKKFYAPPYIASPGSYLVVDGTINAGPGQTIIRLSKTVNLSNATTYNPVLHAIINIESETGESYPVMEAGGGKYVSATLSLDYTRQYRLHIKTEDAHEYLSDLVAVTNSPPIDSVNFAVKNNGIQLYVSTHDGQNNSRYYRWEYEETWVLHSGFYSLYRSNGDTVTERDLANDQIYECWKSDTSTAITLATSNGLSQNVISRAPVTLVGSESPKLDGKRSSVFIQKQPETNAYSILMKQYALTGKAYAYWVNLKKNTQDIGRLFDPTPSEIRGNIHSLTDPNEPVLGYISAGTMTTRRFFIKNGDIPTQWTLNSPYEGCHLDSLYLDTLIKGNILRTNQENTAFNLNRGTRTDVLQIPVQAIYDPQKGFIIGHSGTSPYCADCTMIGTNKTPSFWVFTHQQ
jgi:hypothetical protein